MANGARLSTEDFALLDGTKENARQIYSTFKDIIKELKDELKGHPQLEEFVWPGVGQKTSSPYAARPYIQSGDWRDHMWLGIAHRQYRETVEKPQNGLQLQFLVRSEGSEILPAAGWWLHLDENASTTVRNQVRSNLDNNRDRFLGAIGELSEHHVRVGSDLWELEQIDEDWEAFLDSLDQHLSILVGSSPEEMEELGDELVDRTVEEFERLLPLYSLLSGIELEGSQDELSVWIEKTELADREYKREGPLALGRAIWSPQRAEDGSDQYRIMREVESNDLVIHYLKDEGAFVGISTVESELDDDFVCPPESEWGWEDEDRPAYRYDLTDYTEFDESIDASLILDNDTYREDLEAINDEYSHLFFSRYRDGFRPAQGAYLTRAPSEFLQLLEDQSEELPAELAHRRRGRGYPERTPAELGEEIIAEIEATEQRPELYRQALAHLVSGKNLVFYGAPGTGKTRAARLLSRHACAGDVTLKTANAEWTNYEVVGGPRLQVDGSWEDEPGFFTRAANGCVETLATSRRPNWLIIDELNRANLDEAFGEVFTLLDLDYRSDRPLPIDDIHVPLSFRVLATMNTYDKAQLFALGYAFMRRFAFLEVPSLLERSDRTSPTQTNEVSVDVDRLDLRPEMHDVREIVERSVVEHFSGEAHEQFHETDSPLGFPEIDDEINAEENLRDLSRDTALQTRGHDFIDALLLFAQEVTDRDVVEIGQALIIDCAKYVVAYSILFPEETGSEVVDQAIVAYVIPQFDYYMPKLRKAITMGGDPGMRDRLDEIIAIADGLGFEETATLLIDAKQDMRVIG